MNNLILTIMHGYDYPFVEPFIKSLKATGYKGELVIFTSDTVSNTTKKALATSGAVLIPYRSVYPFKPEYAGAFKNIVPGLSISNYRFVFYLQFLLDNPGRYQNVMLTDIRDVIFQQDPFIKNTGENINFFLEDPVQTFRNSQLNYQWCAAANGEVVTNRIVDEIVSCAGVTIGATALIIDYLQYIKSKLEFRDELPWAFDQGIHNGYVYDKKPAGMRIYNYDEPYVSNMGAYQPYKTNVNGEVINSAGEAYAVLHQYDRFGELLMKVKERYVGSRLVQKFKRVYYSIMP